MKSVLTFSQSVFLNASWYNLNMYTVKLTFLRRKPVLRQILKTNETNKNTDVTRKTCGEVFLIKAAAQCPEERVNLPGYTINRKLHSKWGWKWQLQHIQIRSIYKKQDRPIEWLNFSAKRLHNSTPDFHGATRTSSTRHQNINFWLMCSRVTQTSEITFSN